MSRESSCPDCGNPQDRYGYHALSCKVASGAIDKHNSIVKGLYDFIKRNNISCSMEAFNPASDSRERPGDISIPDFDVYGDGYFDLSVISIVAPSYISRASKGNLEGSKIRYFRKIGKYPDLGKKFKPLILECTGGWHPNSLCFLKTIAGRIAANSNLPMNDALNRILTMASCRLQRHQGNMLVRRCLGL